MNLNGRAVWSLIYKLFSRSWVLSFLTVKQLVGGLWRNKSQNPKFTLLNSFLFLHDLLLGLTASVCLFQVISVLWNQQLGSFRAVPAVWKGALEQSRVLYAGCCCRSHWKSGNACLRIHRWDSDGLSSAVPPTVCTFSSLCPSSQNPEETWVWATSAAGLHFAKQLFEKREQSVWNLVWCAPFKKNWCEALFALFLFKRHLDNYLFWNFWWCTLHLVQWFQ